jgi:16S rRNA (cytosine967-C5)-methyltransferase
MNARETALIALGEVLQNYKPSNLTLYKLLKKYSLSRKDKALVTELTYGTLRELGRVDYALSKFVNLKKIDNKTRNILRIAAYEILFLRIPEYASVNQAVSLASKKSLVNASLRNLCRKPPKNIPIKNAFPEWLVKKWENEFGKEATLNLCEFYQKRPSLSIRVNTTKISRDEFEKRIETKFERGKYCDGSYTIEGEIARLESFKKGFFYIQDEAETLVSLALGPKPGEVIIDLCCGIGGKLSHTGSLMKDRGILIGVDIDKKRLKTARENLNRMGIDAWLILGDGRNIWLKNVDRVLVDAPCSGTGVLRRRPEMKWRLQKSKIRRLQRLQYSLLENAGKFLRRGGILLYSTCSIEKDENEVIINRFLKNNRNFRIVKIELPKKLVDKQGFFYSFPPDSKIDGAFAAKLIKL